MVEADPRVEFERGELELSRVNILKKYETFAFCRIFFLKIFATVQNNNSGFFVILGIMRIKIQK